MLFFKSQTKQLITILEKLVALLSSEKTPTRFLNSEGQTHWVNWMEESKRRLTNSDYSGIEYLLKAYGGMGSFNDISFEDKEKNNKFLSLKSKAYELAKSIKKIMR